MRILADENIPRVLVEALRARGHNVKWIAETEPGADDKTVLRLARREGRTLLTADKGFGLLARIRHVSSGVILIRLRSAGPRLLAEQAVTAIEKQKNWSGHYGVVEVGRVRIRKLED